MPVILKHVQRILSELMPVNLFKMSKDSTKLEEGIS